MKLILSVLFFLLACGADLEPELGTAEQPVCVKNSPTYTYGTQTASDHRETSCTGNSNALCTVPQTKGATYYISTSLSVADKADVHNAIAFVDGKTNWTFTETTDQVSATLTFNKIDNICLDGVGISKYVCVNLTVQGGTLTETPTALPNTYTTHTKGAIHYDQASVFSTFTNGTQRNYVRYHGFIAAITSWMGLGATFNSDSPARQSVLTPLDTINDFTAGEVCRMNGFLPAAQCRLATTIGVIASCTD